MTQKKLVLIGLLLVASQGMSQKKKDPVLMTVNGKDVHQSEFISIYTKNNPNPKYDKQSLDEYMDLFVKYKLKVTEAEQLRMDTISKFMTELEGYREQLARPYLTDKEMNDELIKQAYYRQTHEIKASHILIQNIDGSPIQRGGATFGEAELNKILEIKGEIESGKISFEDAALKYSQDPSARDNKGLLGYFSAFQMVYPFEEAAFNTKVGQISDPVKTRFGYHIIKVHDSREARGRIKVAHIYAKAPEKATEEEKEKAKKKIDEIYTLLKGGKDFAELAKEYSEDNTSASSGGELEWFGTGRMLPDFEEASYGLKNNGDYSEPVRTSYGWHIIKRMDYEPLPSLEESEGQLKARISRDARSNKSRDSFVEKLKLEYHFKDFSSKWMSDYVKAYNATDSGDIVKRVEKFNTEKAFYFYFKKGKISPIHNHKVKEFTQKYVANAPEASDIQELYNNFIADALIDFEKSRLEVKYPEYKALMQEYKDGILLFELTDQKVWKMASKDTVGLEAFYEQNKENYKWKERADVEIYTAVKKENIYKAYELVKDSGYNANEVVKSINQSSQLNLSVESEKFEIADKKELTNRNLTKGVMEPFVLDGKFVLLKVNELLDPSIKKLDETRGLVISDYQTYLEKEWIKELKAKYPVAINNNILYSLGD